MSCPAKRFGLTGVSAVTNEKPPGFGRCGPVYTG
jgi:hypothetical protein